MISQEFSSEKIRKRSRRRVSRPTTATNDEQQNVDRNYAVINLETYTHTHTRAHIYITSRTHNPPSAISWTERERERRERHGKRRSHTNNKNTRTGKRTHTAGTGRCGVLHRWLGIFVFSGWHRPAFTRLHAPPGCIMHVCGSRREFKPTTSADLSPLSLSLSLFTPPPSPGFNPGFFLDTQHFSFSLQWILRWIGRRRRRGREF